MSVIVPDDILEAAHMTADEVRQELAVLFFQREKLTLAQASKLAGMTRIQFQHLLASRAIPVHYDEADLAEDVAALKETGRL